VLVAGQRRHIAVAGDRAIAVVIATTVATIGVIAAIGVTSAATPRFRA